MNMISIYVIGTNNYFPLALKFIRKFNYHYKGKYEIEYLFFGDENPNDYLNIPNLIYFETSHSTWRDGTNSKFQNLISNKDKINSDYIFYFDADTDIRSDFTEEWFLGDIVGGQHWNHVNDDKPPFERRERSAAYVPIDSPHPQIYYYGAFFGGTAENMINLCQILREMQTKDSLINLEPIWNDESYLNNYFHYNPPKMVKSEDFKFFISDKGGIHTRDEPKNEIIMDEIKKLKNLNWTIENGEIILIS